MEWVCPVLFVWLKATQVISQKCVAVCVSLVLFRPVTRESMDLEKAFDSTPTTDTVLVNRNGESKVLGKPAADLPDCPIRCWALEMGARTLCWRTLSSQAKNQFCSLWISLLSWFFLTSSETRYWTSCAKGTVGARLFAWLPGTWSHNSDGLFLSGFLPTAFSSSVLR